MEDISIQIADLEEQIAKLPVGYISEKMYGKITRRCVLYKSESGIASNGIEYKNVKEFLKV